MADENKEVKLNELDEVNGGLIGTGRPDVGRVTIAGGAGAPLIASAPLVSEAAAPIAAAAAPLIEASRPMLPFATLEEANTYAKNAGMDLFATLEAANSWINTGGRASIL